MVRSLYKNICIYIYIYIVEANCQLPDDCVVDTITE